MRVILQVRPTDIVGEEVSCRDVPHLITILFVQLPRKKQALAQVCIDGNILVSSLKTEDSKQVNFVIVWKRMFVFVFAWVLCVFVC